MTEKQALQAVAFKVDKEKYCPDCFREVFFGRQIRFSSVYLAVQILSQIKKCYNCEEEITSRNG